MGLAIESSRLAAPWIHPVGDRRCDLVDDLGIAHHVLIVAILVRADILADSTPFAVIHLVASLDPAADTPMAVPPSSKFIRRELLFHVYRTIPAPHLGNPDT